MPAAALQILLVDDDEALRNGLAENLREEGWTVIEASGGGEAMARLDAADLMVTDVRMPDIDGLDLLVQARSRKPTLEMIVMTGFGSIPSAVEAMKRGARAYLAKPFDPLELILHVREVAEKLALRRAAATGGRGALVGASAAMRAVYREIDAAAAGRAPVLITGETGTGKDLAARAVHALSGLRGDFVPVNLGALPRELVESELFGHEKGAFTGANARKRGRFLLADNGTLFLDEIDALPIELQPKLLRVLENQEVWPLGAEKPTKAAPRIVAATNARIEEKVADGTFREDLYFRLNVLRILMPPLRERIEEIPSIARALLDRFGARMAPPRRIEIEGAALARLMERAWPGNVRELANLLERALARAGQGAGTIALRPEHFDLEPGIGALTFAEAKERMIADWTRRTLATALAETGGNVSKAADRLKLNRTSLIRLMNQFEVKR
jgi:DNA-binding NtrC family response regulator